MRSLFKTLALLMLVLLPVALTSCSNGTQAEAERVTASAEATTTTTDPGPSKADLQKVWIAVQTNRDTERWNNTIKWVNTTNWVDATNARLAAEEAARQKELAAEKAASNPPSMNTPGNGRCGGNLPPCCLMNRESGGNITAQNPTSSASGKWQVISSTWNGYMGYPSAASAPEWVQDQFAAQLWAGGAGSSHWGGGC